MVTGKYYETLIEQGVEIPEYAHDRAGILLNGLIARATGGDFEGGDPLFKSLRREFITESKTKNGAVLDNQL